MSMLDAMQRADHLQRVLERAFNDGDFSSIDDAFAPDGLFHDPGHEMRGTRELKIGVTMLRQAFPDFHFTVEDTLTDGDRVAVRYRGQGTQHGEFKGIPATGRAINCGGMLMAR